MDKMKFLCILFCVVCYVDFGIAGNSLKDPYICGPPTCNPAHKFKYLLEVNYHYDYTVNVNTWFAESSNNQSTLNITARVKIQFITPCEGLLQLSNVVISDQDENYPMERQSNFMHAVSVHDLRFAFHDGVISELCPNEGEEDWVLNFKRGLLSLYQNSMSRFDINYRGVERDVHGTCNVDYTVRGQENTSLVMVKKRDLNQCTDRYKYLSILQTVRYNFQSKFQTWPVLQSESKCLIHVDHKVYKSVSCRERHLFEPFSGKNSGAMTTVVQDLVLVREDNKTDTELMDSEPKTWNIITVRSNLLHHHSHYARVATGELKSARDVLKMLCKTKESTEDIESEDKLDSSTTVALWGSLVRASRGLSHPALAQLLQRADTICDVARKHILDALPYIASAGSVELIKDIVLKKSIDKTTRDEWLMSMAMIPRPKSDMLVSILELLKEIKNDQVVSFTVSSMLHSYCKHSRKSMRECCQESTPKQILTIFEDIVNEILKEGLSNASREKRDNMVIAIKALGNIGGFDQEFSEVLLGIISDPLTPINIRLTAIDAFRKTPCLETREYFLEMYRSDNIEVEIRISSYLQVMKCPKLATLRKIFFALKHERVNQVATFVWSHLNNLGQSSLPSRVEIQGLLSGNTVPQLEDEPDFRMFSRNYEQSVFYDQFNAGGNYEANVIFSPDSYIPRSLSLNLTVDMFGESINLLEIKTRIEGFERYFESIFGPKGPLSKTKINDQIQNLRILRSLYDADETRERIDKLNYQNEGLKHQYPLAELGIKVFGNEISFWSLEGDTEIKKTLSKLNPQMRVLEILSGKEISYNKASLFLDTTYSVPTGSGLPLNMHLMGTSYVNMNMSGNFVENFNNAKELSFEGNIHPSIALNIAATMGVIGGGHTSTGVRINARLYTSTAVEAKLNIDGLKKIKLDLSLPRSKQQIFAAKSELIILHGDKEVQQQGLNMNQIEHNTCSWSTFDQAIGIKLCAAYQFPNMTNIHNAPYFIMSGPAKYILSLEKADPSAKTFALEYLWHQNETSDSISFSYNTPQSLEKRMFNAALTLSQNLSTASMSFQSSQNKVEAKALYRNMELDKAIEASLIVNGHKNFDTVMSLNRQDIKFGFVWLPHAYWVVNDERIAELTGSMKVKSKGGVTQWDILADFQTKQLASRLLGYYTQNGPTNGAKLQLDYQFYKNPKQTVKLEGLYSERFGSNRHDLYGELSMAFTAYPTYDFYAVLKNVKSQSHTDISFNVSASREQKDKPTFAYTFVKVDKHNGMKLRTDVVLTKPRPMKMLFNFEEIGSKYNALVQLNFNPKSRDIVVSGYLFYPPGTQLHMDCELNTTLPTLHPANIKAKLHEKQTNQFQLNTQGVWFTGVDFNIDASYHDQSKTNMASHKVKAMINSSHFKDIAVDVRFMQDNRQFTFSGQGEYNDDKYRVLLRHVLISENNFTSFAELDIGEKAYIIDVAADLTNNTNMVLDLHFDQLRDVHISYQRWLSPTQKRLSASLNWDANRDPSQKISLDMQMDHNGPLDHQGQFTIYYPDQAINGDFHFLLKDWFCQYHIRMGWSSEDVILWKVKMYSEVNNQTVYALLSKLNTPFVGWQDTSFNLMWRYQNNLQVLNGSMNWQEDYLSFNLLGDYMFKTNEFFGEISAVVNSTIQTLPKAAAVARHHVVWKKSADTLLSFQYNEEGMLMINSSWILDRGEKENNVTGLVKLVTPFQGYKKGSLDTKFVFGHKRDINGVSYFNLEEKSMKINVNGHMRRLTNSMLIVNVTSPDNDVVHLTARFGFIEIDRHLVAMVVTPSSTTGVEVLLKLVASQDFHIFGHVALPVQYLNRAMLVAKRSKDEAEFLVGWGAMDFGFLGKWQYASLTNFEYSYKLFTPIEGFAENGLVLKNKYGPGLDTELSVRLSKHKFGISILLHDNGKGFIDVISDKINGRTNTDADVLLENFDTKARVIINTLSYPTIIFDSHIVKLIGANEEDIFQVNATLQLPNNASIILNDTFILEEYTVMQNHLSLQTPFKLVQQLQSIYTVDIILGEKFNVTCEALVHNGSFWNEISYKVFYEYSLGEDETFQSHSAHLSIVTPLVVLPSLKGDVTVRLEDSLWRMGAMISMPSFMVTALGSIELDDPFVQTSGSLNLTSEYLQDYFIKMQFKKDFSDLENVVAGGIQVQQGVQNNYLYADVIWRPLPELNIKVKSRAALYPVLPHSDLALEYMKENNLITLWTDLSVGNVKYALKAETRNNGLSVSWSSPHEMFRAAKLLAEFENDDVRGSFVTDAIEYSINGKILNREPFEMSANLVPKNGGDTINVRIKYNITDTEYSGSAHFSEPLLITVHGKAVIDKDYTDVNFKLDSPNNKERDTLIKARMDSYPGLRRVVNLQAITPIKRLKYFKGDTDFIFGPKTGYVLCKYDMPDMKADGDLKWSFLMGDLYIKALGHQHLESIDNITDIDRKVDLDIYFGNNTKNAMTRNNAGFRMDLDGVWQIGANTSIGFVMNQQLFTEVNVILPKPNVDVHSLLVSGKMEGSLSDVNVLYSTDVTKLLAGVQGKLLNELQTKQVNASLLWRWNDTTLNYTNTLKYIQDDISHNIYCGLTNTKNETAIDDLFELDGVYLNGTDGRPVVRGTMSASANQIGLLDLHYGGIKHTDGHFNVSTPFKRLPWLKSIFDIINTDESSNNHIDLFWPNKTASINSTHQINQSVNFTQTGNISLSIPLNTQHLVSTEYVYNQSNKTSNGNAIIDLDNDRFVKVSFEQLLTNNSEGLEVTFTDIEIENAHTPVGVKYEHEYDLGGNVDIKQATVFHLHNTTKFNVTGKIDVTTSDTGKQVKLTAIQGLRTLTFENQYETLEKELKQGSKIKWKEDIWINYDIHVVNMTQDDIESQQITMNVYYPKRTFNLVGLYKLQDTMLDGNARLNWNVYGDNKTAELKGKWENPNTGDGNLHLVDLALVHPSFRKDVTIKGKYISTPSVMSNLLIELQYSDYENEYLRLQSLLLDNSNGPIRDYKFELMCQHPATNLDLEMFSKVQVKSRWYNIDTKYRYKKSMFTEKLSALKVLADFNNNSVQYERLNETYFYKMNGSWFFTYPDYKLVSTVLRPTGNDTGHALLSLKDKSVIAHYNSTDDISYHMIGMIVDTRSAKLNAWRDFDDVTTIDLASYIRLNHSRLLTSSLVWRPEIFSEVKSSALGSLKIFYNMLNDSITILKEAPMEGHMALKNIWMDARPRIKDFLDDLNDLHVIKDDLDEFEQFLNESYNDNDFYVKDIVEFTNYVLDEMAIRNHLESLPGIVNDMWGMMGNTSQSIKQSLMYVINTVKHAYANVIESTNKFLEADFMELVSNNLEVLILKYDNFVRNLHMKLIDYWEATWINASSRLSRYWHDIIKSVEPLFFKVMHYTESFIFTIWRGVMDFFYNRTQELTDSPYFNYVSTFGHEMDTIYKDLTNNDLVTNIKKYSSKFFNVIWTKIENYIPFKDEISQLYLEFKDAWERFLLTPQVLYVREKYQEAYFRLKWWYDYFLIGDAIETVGQIVYEKLTSLAKTALQYEEEHRTPKTNFIFDPHKGEIILEQKLPMSWHTFNRTPDFKEIAEYKAVTDFMNEWLTTNKSIWSYYNEIRPYMDINNVLPPFGGMAIMTGQGTVVTFDKRVFTITESGTFLLTKDYKQNNFTILMESNDQDKYNLVLMTKKNMVHIDLYSEQVIVNGAPIILPSLIDACLIERQTDMLLIQAPGDLVIQCNLLFHTCNIRVTGWYYASLGGLFGSFNNEQYDDLQLPNSTIVSSVKALQSAWNIDNNNTRIINRAISNDTSCDKYFRNKVSPLYPCFSVIDATPFLKECSHGVDACVLANTYLELCLQQHIPIHAPEQCLQCTTPQGDIIEDGGFYKMENIPNSTDIVFIIEAHECNKNLRKIKNLDLFIEAFDSKMQGSGLADNRYAIVAFGGRNLYKKPKSLYTQNNVFLNSIEIPQHFDNLVFDKTELSKNTSHSDMFEALSYSNTLPFRPGITRTLILMPCSKCDIAYMKLDYSTIYHNLIENSVTLHILMDDELLLNKRRAAKYLFAIDSTKAYTSRDYEKLQGDEALRKQVKLPKDKLGFCTSLALETNGSIMSGGKLRQSRNVCRRFASVAGGVAGVAATPCRKVHCDCKHSRLHCGGCQRYVAQQMSLQFWDMDESAIFDDIVDMAIEPPSLPTFT